MKNKIYQAIIGLEAHVELKTKSKMFCRCSADYFGHEPNTHVCPVCLGLPGALPVPNKIAIEWCITIGLALNCEIPLFSKFDRKNYFYPDLPKGYQISQYDQPFCVNGSVKLSSGKIIKIRRVHMEEDTGKLIHGAGATLIDFNRSGVPLVEIVTEPDFASAEEVVGYLKKLQQIVRYLNVSTADMEKGKMRLEPNISLKECHSENDIPGYKVEVKNINSFRFVEKAIDYELERQRKIIEDGKTAIQETRGWDEKKQITVSQRTKEEAHDYRYFPEPDIPPLRWTKNLIRQLTDQITELPDAKLERFRKEYGLSDYDGEILTREKETADYFEEAVKVGNQHKISPKQIANAIINKRINIDKALPTELIVFIKTSSEIIEIDEKELDETIKTVLKQNKKAVEDYKNDKTNALMYLVGQVMRKYPMKIDATGLREKLEKMLK